MATTQNVRRPRKRPPAKKGKKDSELTQLRKFMWRHRDNMAPIGVAVVVLLVALLVEPYPLAPLWLPMVGAGLAALLYIKPWSSAPRAVTIHTWRWSTRRDIPWEEKERAYAGGVALAAGVWAGWFALGGVRPLAVYPFLVALLAFPWWQHRAPRASVPVTMARELTGTARRRAETRTRQVIDGWDVITRQGRIPGAKLLAIAWDLYSMSVVVELKGGMGRKTLTYRGYSDALESAFDAPSGSFRAEDPGDVQGHQRKAKLVRLRFLMSDPNATPLGRPPGHDPDRIVVGRFETGAPVVYAEGVHTGVFGASGAGKSGLMNTIIRAYRQRRNTAMIGIDLKPGAPEFSPWDRAWYYLADSPEKAKFALAALLYGLNRRGDVMKERGWRKWKCTPAEPGVALFVDEVQLAGEHGLMKDLEKLAGISRAYGFEMILATQRPVDKNLPTVIYGALVQIFGLRVDPKADRVVFGETANQDGWTPSKLPKDGGRFLVQAPAYTTPLPARGHWMEDEDVAEENATGPEAVQLDFVMGHMFVTSGEVEPVDVDLVGSGGQEAHMDIVDAVVVEDTGPRGKVLEAVRDGIGTPAAIAKTSGIPVRTVKLYLAELAAVGAIHQDAARKPWRTLN